MRKNNKILNKNKTSTNYTNHWLGVKLKRSM